MSTLEKIRSGELKTKDAGGKSSVWAYFKKIVREVNGVEEVQPFVICSTCEHIFKYTKGSSTSNLKKHHCFKNLDEAKMNLSTCGYLNSRKKTCINISDEVKAEITEKCVQYVTQDLRSFSAVNGSGFRELARCLVETGVKLGSTNFDIDDILPHSTTVSRALQEIHQRQLDGLIFVLQPLLDKGWCAATTDMWTESTKQRNFISITIHYLDLTWRLHSRVLCTIEINNFDEDKNPEKKTGINILRALEEKLINLNLGNNVMEKLTFTTDQGSNMKKALEKCSRINCIVHILNLILTDTFKTSVLQEIAPSVLQTLTRCKALVEYLKRSGSCQRLDTTVRQECISRWNTKFDMLLSIRKNFNTIENLLECAKEKHRLDGIEKYLLDRLILFLQLFKKETLVFQAEKEPTIQLVLLHMHILKERLLELHSNETNSEVKALINHCLYNVFDNKFQPHRLHKIAAFLWPEYKQLRFLENNMREEVYTLVREELTLIIENSHNSADTLNPIVDIQEGHTESTDCSIFNDCEEFYNKYKDIYADDSNNWQSKENVEMELYKGCRVTDRNILSWWRSHENEFPLLHQLSRKILCIPAFSASSERAFSSVKRVLEDRRSILKGENLDAVLFLNSAGKC